MPLVNFGDGRSVAHIRLHTCQISQVMGMQVVNKATGTKDCDSAGRQLRRLQFSSVAQQPQLSHVSNQVRVWIYRSRRDRRTHARPLSFTIPDCQLPPMSKTLKSSVEVDARLGPSPLFLLFYKNVTTPLLFASRCHREWPSHGQL